MIIKKDLQELANYLEDTSNLKGKVDILYIPENKDEVLSVIGDCLRNNMPFTVVGARTGTTAGCTPREGAVISFEKLNKIIDIDRDTKIAKVQAGVCLGDLEREANKLGLSLRASPTESLAFIGGVISTCASGVRGFGYGSIRNYIKRLEIVLATKDIINIKRGEILSEAREFDFKCKDKKFKFKLPTYQMPKVKSQAGYFVKDSMDLIDLFIGSEGTLGVITCCEVMLQRMPFSVFDGLVFFKKEEAALSFVDKIKQLKKENILKPASLEFFDENSLNLLKEEYSFVPDADAAVYFEQEAQTEENCNYLLEVWQNLIEQGSSLADKSILADTSGEREKLFEFRHQLPQMINEFLRRTKQVKVATDIAVPWQNFRKMYDFYKSLACQSKIDYVNFGHIGENHLHFNFLPKNDIQAKQAREYIMEFCRKAVFLRGTVSAEHGIGKIKKPYLKIMYNQQGIKEMAALKKYFDPYCLLGLDNIFDKELLNG